MPHPPLSVCGLFLGSAARFHSSTLRLQFRVAPMISLRTGAPMFTVGFPSTDPVTICSVKYRFFVGWALCTSLMASIFPPYRWKPEPSTYLAASASSRMAVAYCGSVQFERQHFAEMQQVSLGRAVDGIARLHHLRHDRRDID